MTFEQIQPISQKSEQKTGTTSFDTACEIMGRQNVYGPDEIQNTFGFRPEHIPEIPFSATELENAKRLGQELVLYVNETAKKEPLTYEKMDDIYVQNKTSQGYSTFVNSLSKSDLKKDAFLSKESPRDGWRLVGKEMLPTTLGKNYLEQLDALVEYLRTEVFTQTMPEPFQSAITEYESVKKSEGMEDDLYTDDVSRARLGKKMSTLLLNNLCRERYTEILYRSMLHEKSTDKGLVEQDMFAATCSDNTANEFMYVSPSRIRATGEGMGVGGRVSLHSRFPNVGAYFFRPSTNS